MRNSDCGPVKFAPHRTGHGLPVAESLILSLKHSWVIELLAYFRTDRENPRGDIKEMICRLLILKSTYHKESFSTAKRAAFSISLANKESISTIERPNTSPVSVSVIFT
jgi:hypothetical protein